MESILAKMSEDRNGDFYNYRRVVRLNGKLCSDFRSSVEEICWQLKFSDFNEEGSENTFEDVRSTANFDGKTCKNINYAILVHVQSPAFNYYFQIDSSKQWLF